MRSLAIPLIAAAGAVSCHRASVAGPLCGPHSGSRSTIAWEPGATDGEIRGRVVRVRTGEPLPDAIVRLQPSARRAEVDGTGSFQLPKVPAGRYELSVNYIGMVPARDSITLNEAGAELLVALAGPAGDDLVVCVCPAPGQPGA